MGAKLSGSSGKKYAIEQNADINVTPFVDVMLVLLIIFMVAAPLATQSLKLDLPPPPKEPPKTKTQVIVIQMADSGDILVGPREQQPIKTSIATLPGDLHTVFVNAGLTSPDDQKVNITAMKHVRYGAFMDVLNTLEKNGYPHVNLIIQ